MSFDPKTYGQLLAERFGGAQPEDLGVPHPTDIQHTVAQYFMTQRIKAADAKYVEKLTAAHAVMVAAMKCKQAADPATAVALDKAIHDFQHAYGGDH